ncbi:MAG: hypothetical protein AABM67_20750 [Acidobacteriota bacterium]
MNDSTKSLLSVIIAATQLVLLVVGALWAYYRFWREGSHRRRVEFSIDCNFFGPQQEQYLAEFRLHAVNKGVVVHRFPSIELRVLGLKKSDPISFWEDRKPRVEFPHKVMQAEIVHDKYSYIFVEPGVEQVITYVTTFPAEYRFILARAEFRYDRRNPHSAEKVFELTPSDQR